MIVPIVIDAASNGVNGVYPNGVSIHPVKPDLISPWRHTKKWQWVPVADLYELSKIVTSSCWSPCAWRHAYRMQDYFSHSDWGGLDVDGRYDLDQACKDWSDTISIIVTTKSDKPDYRRFRILFPWVSRIEDVNQYIYNSDYLSKKYDSDEQATDGARFFWPGREIVQVVSEGLKQPVLSMPENYLSISERDKRTCGKYSALGQHGIFPQNVKSWLKGNAVDGKRNNFCYSIGKYLTYWGMPPDEIINLVMKSKIPLDFYNSQREAENAVNRGIKKAEKTKGNESI